MPAATNPNRGEIAPDFRVAIIGGGITGINLALGLQARKIPFTIYERAPAFGEIGAGIGFSPNAERAMAAIDPSILAAFKAAANPNGEDYFQWVDGHATEEVLFKLHVGKDGFQGGLRSDILDAWARLVKNPSSTVQFGKTLATIDSSPSSSVVTLHFTDRTTATASAVIGCDGIRSRVRQLLLGEDSPAALPHYTSKFCYRALVPMDRAVAAVGQYKAGTRFMHNGPGAHVITYPVGGNKVLNVLAVLSDKGEWTDKAKHTGPGSKQEVLDAFASWGPTVRGIVDLMPEQMDKWAIFDMLDYPAERYNKGRVCIAGDAAHATGPHLGAGGGMGIEDALVLSELMDAAARGVGGVERALEAYNEIRYERTQAVVKATRKACLLFHWQVEEVGNDGGKFGKEIAPMFLKVWEYDQEKMVEDALAMLE
ncbi:salicylate hydroxylase [Podospora aff. communis PSN243]|uniref:Salicylate hydroxylase n=1 Tax=Podospora aff. communis PSN243 TaxID=3040156 RepID=A0AAV9H2A5_9PEZI|nr:salicylate hydroxylase [Podospora aff. communis PSN243]